MTKSQAVSSTTPTSSYKAKSKGFKLTSTDKNIKFGGQGRVSITLEYTVEDLEGDCKCVTYLHTGFPRVIISREITPQNIFLDENGAAKLSSFGLSISIPEGESCVC